MRTLRWSYLPALFLLATLLASSVAAYAAANTVPATRLGQQTNAITANTLKPSACASISLTSIVTGSGTFNGTT
ncbi:MAG TPA: hypothetical protein VK449_01720, partial [Anaerolineales bacterium]|nr:hypothetical protein [Anaerolineales bacterium]